MSTSDDPATVGEAAWTLSRRALLELVAAVTVAAAAGPSSAAALIVYDARVPRSRAFAVGSAEVALDVAQEEGDGWRRLRRWPGAGRVIGLTRWSEYVQVRGVLQERGLRARRELRHGDLLLWEMA